MLLRFSKMHGLGNDFMVVDLVTQHFAFRPELIRQLADRHRGIGFDQLLVVEPPYNPEADFRYRIFNADGSEVSQCGNGARCFALFVHTHRLTGNNPVRVETRAGLMEITLHNDDQASVVMETPEFDVAKVPLVNHQRQDLYTLSLAGDNVQASALSLGNPHAVVLVDSVAQAPIERWGKAANESEDFPEGVNLGAVEVVDRQRIKLRVYERGVGETQACGSGACAAMIACHQRGLVDDEVVVELPGGNLTVTWPGSGKVTLKGPAVRVYDGKMQV